MPVTQHSLVAKVPIHCPSSLGLRLRSLKAHVWHCVFIDDVRESAALSSWVLMLWHWCFHPSRNTYLFSLLIYMCVGTDQLSSEKSTALNTTCHVNEALTGFIACIYWWWRKSGLSPQTSSPRLGFPHRPPFQIEALLHLFSILRLFSIQITNKIQIPKRRAERRKSK